MNINLGVVHPFKFITSELLKNWVCFRFLLEVMKRNPNLVAPLEITSLRGLLFLTVLPNQNRLSQFQLKAKTRPVFETLWLNKVKKMEDANSTGQTYCNVPRMSS
jgi:hypothetical protein